MEEIVAEEPYEFLMEDVPENLQPHSILLEIIDQMEDLKQSLQPVKERD